MTDSGQSYYARLEELFTRALAMGVEERAAFLGTLEEKERGELMGLLAYARETGPGLEGIVGKMAAGVVGGEGGQFGPYRLVRELGRGGMGVVYEARREGEFEQRVALKVAPQWQGNERMQHALRSERQILASLQHAHIAQLYDGGTEDGIPYFAMEYVDGVPLTEYAREKGLGVEGRIRLFLPVLEAVHYAHLAMVVHRDLKPTNILVTAGGVAKLLDFGIAKVLDPMGGGATVTALMFTPDYASPEQVRGMPVTAATDVYALGLILYELLTGVKGQKADVGSALALDASICEAVTPLASTVVEGKLREALRGDLDNILECAVRKEAGRRYATVAGLKADLEAYLEGRPVAARAAGAGYRVGKFLKRNRGMVAAGVLVAAAVVGGVVSTVYQARRAERRFQQVRTLANEFLFGVHDSIQGVPGTLPARRAIVETTLRYLENLREEAAGDEALGIEVAEAYRRIGDLQGGLIVANLGDREGANRSYEKAQALLEPLAERGVKAARIPFVTLSASRSELAREKGDQKEAVARLERARGHVEAALREAPEDRMTLSAAAGYYGSLGLGMERTAGAESYEVARRGLELAEKLNEKDGRHRENRLQLATARRLMGLAMVGRGELEEGARMVRGALGVREELVREDAENGMARRDLVVGYGHLADVLGGTTGQNLGDYRGAMEALGKGLGHVEWMRKREPADVRMAFDELSLRARLGVAEMEAGEGEAALRSLEKAGVLLDGLMKGDAKSYRYRYMAAFLQRKRGEGLARLGRYREGLAEMDGAVQKFGKLVEGPNGGTARLALWLVKGERVKALVGMKAGKEAGVAAGELARELEPMPKGLAPAWNQALVVTAVGEGYWAAGDEVNGRKWLGKGLEMWRGMKVAKALEGVRAGRVAELERRMGR